MFAHMKGIHRLDRLRLRGLSAGKGRGAAHRDGAEPEAAREAPLPIPASCRCDTCSRGDQVASGVGDDAFNDAAR